MNITFDKLKKYVYGYISLPLLVFFVGYLKLYIMLPATCILVITYFQAVQTKKKVSVENKSFHISAKRLLLLLAICLIYTHFCGLNGFWFQTSDWNARNPIFRDIITYDWPVYYANKGSALVYYIGFWLVPAVPAKLAYSLWGMSVGWLVGKICLWIWASLGIFLILLSLFVFNQSNTKKCRIVVLLTFIFFSGMDVIGMWYFGSIGYLLRPDVLHLEWWHPYYQYSSITTCMCWVFNQSVIPWLCTILFLHEKNCRNYLLIGMGCLLSGPFPFVGLVILMMAKAIEFVVAKIKQKEHFKNILSSILSMGNVLMLFVVFPIIGTFMLANNAASGGVSSDVSAEKVSGMIAIMVEISSRIRTYLQHGIILFFILEVGCYLILMWHWHKKDVLYYTVAVSLFLIPYFHVGVSNDFCMRASIPGIFLVMVWCTERTTMVVEKQHKHLSKELKACTVALCAALMIGAITPGVELFRGFYRVATEHTIFLENNERYTLNDRDEISLNFETADAKENIFFKYFAKKLKKQSCELNGQGTIENPYIIDSYESLEQFRDLVNNGYNFLGEYVRQTTDIDMRNCENWIPIGIYGSGMLFRGNYDGDGYLIENLCINSEENAGLFGQLAGTVENVVISNCNINANCVGGIASHGLDGTIINCLVQGEICGTRVGGIADNLSGYIGNCISLVTLSGEKVSGITGYNSSILDNCYSNYGNHKYLEDGEPYLLSSVNSLNRYVEKNNGNYEDLLNYWKVEDEIINLTHPVC